MPSAWTHAISMQLHIQITQIRPDRRIPLALNPFLLFGDFAHLVEHICQPRDPYENIMLISDPQS